MAVEVDIFFLGGGEKEYVVITVIVHFHIVLITSVNVFQLEF